MPKINRNGIKINYETYGNGPALFLTHGFSATSKMWDDQIDYLSKYFKNGRLILKTDDDNLFNFSIDEIKSSKFILNDYTKDLHSSSKFDLYKSVKTKYEKKFLLQGKKIKLLECLK